METVEKDLSAWQTAVNELAELAKIVSPQSVSESDFSTIKDSRKGEREAWQRCRVHWRDNGDE